MSFNVILPYFQTGISTPDQEESYQAAEYDSFFNSDSDSESEEIAAYSEVASESDLLHEQVLTNDLLGTGLAILILYMIFGIVKFLMRILEDNIFKYL